MENIPTLVILLTVIYFLVEIFRKFKPADISKFQTDKPIEELRRKYLKYDLTQIGLFFLFTIILTFVYYYVLIWLSDYRVSMIKETVIIVKPFIAAWFLSAMFTSMLTTTLIIIYLGKWKLKTDWEEYSAYGYMKSGYSPKIGSIVMRIFAIITAILVIGFLDWFTAFRQDDIVINSLFGLGNKTYLYTDIADIRDIMKVKAPNGNIVDDEHYIIIFNDGSKWNSRQNGFANFREDSKIIDLIELKTGRQLTKLEFDTD